MNKYERYFKHKNINTRDNLINTYITYKTDTEKHYIISDGYGVVMVDYIPENFKEINGTLKDSIIKYFENFINKNNNDKIDTFYIDYIKDNLDNDNNFMFSKDYGVNYTMIKKITNIIGGNKINIINKINGYHPIIEIVGKNFQVGYLLPVRRGLI